MLRLSRTLTLTPLRQHLSNTTRYKQSRLSFRTINKMAAPRPLNFYAGPLVWVDCEMTGLNPRKDKILEIAVLITNGNLELVDEGIEFVIRTDKSALDG